MPEHDVQDGASCEDCQQIEQVGRMDSNVQGQVMEDKLGVGIVGGNVKHVSPALSGSQYIDCRSKAAAYGENGDRVFKAPWL